MEDDVAPARVKWQANRSGETGPSGAGRSNRWTSGDKTREGQNAGSRVEKLNLYQIRVDFSKLLHQPVMMVVWNGLSNYSFGR